MNSFLLFVAGLLVVALSALFAAPYFIDWNDYRDVFEAQASKLVGRQVDVGGDVSLTLLPAPVLRFETVNVADAKGGYDTPFASAKSVTVWLSVPPLLSGTIEARSVEIVQPVVNIRLNEDGTGNWSDLGGEAAELPFIPKEVALSSVKISNATVNIWRGKPEPNSVIDSLDGELSARALPGPYKFNGTFTLAGQKKELRFSTARPDENGQFGLKAGIRSPETGDSYTIDGAVRGVGAVPVFKGEFHARLADGSASAQSTEDGGKAQKTAAPFEIKSDMFAGLTGAQFNEFELTITKNDKPQTVTGLMDVKFEKGLVVSGSFSSPWIDLDSWISTGEEAPPDLQTVLSGFADELLDRTSSIREGVVKLQVDQVVLAGDLSTNLSTTLTTKDNAVGMADFSVDLPGSNKLSMEGTLKRSEEKETVFAAPISLTGQSLSRLMRWAGIEADPDVAAQPGEYSLKGNLTAARSMFELTDAEGNLFGSAFTGSLTYRGGENGDLNVALKSDRLDLARLLGAKASAKSLVSLFGLDGSQQENTDSEVPSSTGWLDGVRAEADVNIGAVTLTGLGESALEAKLVRSKDALDIRRLQLTSKGNVDIQAGGRLTGLSGHPQGSLTLAVQADSGAGIRSLGEFFEMPGIAERSPERLAALTPLRITAAVKSVSPESPGLDVQLEGSTGKSDLLMKVALEGKPAEWRSARIDLQGSMKNQSGIDLLQQLRPELTDADLDSFATGGGLLSIEANGVANDGLQTKLTLDAGGANWTMQGAYSTGETESGFSGTTTLAAKNTAAGLALLGIRAAPGQGTEPINVSASVEGAQDVYHFSDLKGEVGGASFTGNLRTDMSKDRPVFTFAINSPQASLPRLFAPIIAWHREKENSAAIRGVTMQEGYWPDAPFDTSLMEEADGSLALTTDRLQLTGGLTLEKANMQAALSDGTLRVSRLDGELYGGTFSATGELASRGGGAALDARVEASELHVDQMIVAADGSPLVNAAAHVTMSVTGEGLTPRGLVSGLRGTGELRLGDGNINGFSLGAAHAAAAAAQKEKADGGVDESELGRQVAESLKSSEMAFTPIKVPFTMGNGIVEFEKIALSDADGRVTIASYLQLANLQLDSEWALQSAANTGGAKPRVSLVFSGDLQNIGKLQPKIDTAGLARYVTIRKMEKDVERLEKLDVSGPKPDSDPAPQQQEAAPPAQAQAPVANEPADATPSAAAAPVAPQGTAPPLPERKQAVAQPAPTPPDSGESPPANVAEPSRKPETQTAAPEAATAQSQQTSEPPPAGAPAPPVTPTIPTAEPPAAAAAPPAAPEPPSADAPEPPRKPTVPSAEPPAAAPESDVAAAPQQAVKPSGPAPLPARKPPVPPAPPPAAAAPAPATPPAAPQPAPSQQSNLPWLQTTNPPAGPQAPAQNPNAPIQLPVPPAASEPPQEQQQAPAPQTRQDDFDPFAESPR